MSLCVDQNSEELAVDDKVLIVGTITALDSPIDGRCMVTVAFTLKGELTSVDFFAEDLIKAHVNGPTINGALSNPT